MIVVYSVSIISWTSFWVSRDVIWKSDWDKLFSTSIKSFSCVTDNVEEGSKFEKEEEDTYDEDEDEDEDEEEDKVVIGKVE